MKVHLPDDIYKMIQKQIDDQMVDEYGHIGIDEMVDLGGIEYNLTVDGKYTVSCSETKFSDGAWGNVQTFTERTCRYAAYDIVCKVSDEDGEYVDTDFDKNKLTLEYEY